MMNNLEALEGCRTKPELLLESLAFDELVTLVSRVTADILSTLQNLLHNVEAAHQRNQHFQLSCGNIPVNGRAVRTPCTSTGRESIGHDRDSHQGAKLCTDEARQQLRNTSPWNNAGSTDESEGSKEGGALNTRDDHSCSVVCDSGCADLRQVRPLQGNGSRESWRLGSERWVQDTAIYRRGEEAADLLSPEGKEKQLLVVQEIAVEAAMGCLQLHRKILSRVDGHFGSSVGRTSDICWRKLTENGEQYLISWDSPSRAMGKSCLIGGHDKLPIISLGERSTNKVVVAANWVEQDVSMRRSEFDSGVTIPPIEGIEVASCHHKDSGSTRNTAGAPKVSVEAATTAAPNSTDSYALDHIQPIEDHIVKDPTLSYQFYRRSSISCRDLQEMRLLHQRGKLNSPRRRGTPSGRRTAGSRGCLMRGALTWPRPNGLVSTVCTTTSSSAAETATEREAKEKRLLCLALCLPFFTLEDIVSTVARLSIGCYNLAMLECPTENLDLYAPGSEHLLLLPGFLEHVVPRARHLLRHARLSCVEHLALTGMMGKSLRELTLMDVPTVAGCSLLPSQLLLRCWNAGESSACERAIAEVAQLLAPLRSLTLWLYALCWRCPLLHSLTIHFYSTLPFSLACGSPASPVEASPTSVFFKLLMKLALVVRNAAGNAEAVTDRSKEGISSPTEGSEGPGQNARANNSLSLPVETLEIVGCSSVMPLALLLCVRMIRLRSLVLTTTSGLSTASLSEFLTLFRQYTLVRSPGVGSYSNQDIYRAPGAGGSSSSEHYGVENVATNLVGASSQSANSVSSACSSDDRDISDASEVGVTWNERCSGALRKRAPQWMPTVQWMPTGLYGDRTGATKIRNRELSCRLRSVSIHHGSNIGVAQLIDALVAFPNLRNLRITSNNSFGSDVMICHSRLEMLEISAHSCLTWDLHLPALRRLQLVVSSGRKEANNWLEPGTLRKWLQQRLLPRSPRLRNFSLRQTKTSLSSMEFGSRKALWDFCYGPFAGDNEPQGVNLLSPASAVRSRSSSSTRM